MLSNNNPERPIRFVSTNLPDDELPVAVIPFHDGNRTAVKELLSNLSPTSIAAFSQANARDAFRLIGQPYGAYDGELPADPVAQVWQRDISDDGSIVVVRRIGHCRFRIKAREGSNLLILHAGDKILGAAPAALLCVTMPGKPSQFMKAGNANIFEGAVYLQDPAATAEFRHVKDHSLRQCPSCTGGKVRFPSLGR